MASGAFNNALSQGIGDAIGVHGKFSWAAVAAAGIGDGVGAWASARLPGAAHTIWEEGPKGPVKINVPATASNRFGSSMAQLIADAGARSLVDGSDFGDNIIAALPNVIGQTIGEAIAGGIAGYGEESDWEAQFDGIDAQGSTDAGYDDKPFLGLKQNRALDPSNSNAEPRRNWWDRFWGGAADFFGFDNGRFSLGNVGLNAQRSAAIGDAYGDAMSEVIIVTAPIRRDIDRIIHLEVPRFGRSMNRTIQEDIAQPIQSFGRWGGTIFTDPVLAARQHTQFWRDFSDASARFASTDWEAATGALVNEYRNAAADDGVPGVVGLGLEHAGSLAPYAVMGPYGAEAGAYEIGALARLTQNQRQGVFVRPLNPGTRFYVSPNGEILDASTYARPSGFRAGVRDEAWAAAVHPETGLVHDWDGVLLDRTGEWHMGHRPGMEYWKERDFAIGQWLDDRTYVTRSEFLDRMNNPSRHRPEARITNESHRGEDPTNWFWID